MSTRQASPKLPNDEDAERAVLLPQRIGVLSLEETEGRVVARLRGADADMSRVAVFGIVHPPKGDADPSGPAIGSVAWTTVARIVLALGPDPTDESHERRVVAVGPTNYKPPASALSFRLPEGKYECAVVADVATSTTTAGDLLARPVADESQSKLDEARAWLNERLKPHGKNRDSAEVKADAKREGALQSGRSTVLNPICTWT